MFIELFFKRKYDNLGFFQMKIEMLARIFFDKMKHFSLKRRLDEDDFENYFEAFFPPVNEGVDKLLLLFQNF